MISNDGWFPIIIRIVNLRVCQIDRFDLNLLTLSYHSDEIFFLGRQGQQQQVLQ